MQTIEELLKKLQFVSLLFCLFLLIFCYGCVSYQYNIFQKYKPTTHVELLNTEKTPDDYDEFGNVTLRASSKRYTRKKMEASLISFGKKNGADAVYIKSYEEKPVYDEDDDKTYNELILEAVLLRKKGHYDVYDDTDEFSNNKKKDENEYDEEQGFVEEILSSAIKYMFKQLWSGIVSLVSSLFD